MIASYNNSEITLTLLRDGNEVQHRIQRTPISIPLDNVTQPVLGLAYFIQAVPIPAPDLGSQPITSIWVTFEEAHALKKKIAEIDAEMPIKSTVEQAEKDSSDEYEGYSYFE